MDLDFPFQRHGQMTGVTWFNSGLTMFNDGNNAFLLALLLECSFVGFSMVVLFLICDFCGGFDFQVRPADSAY